MKKILAAIFVIASASLASAQSSPNLITGQVPTAAQWNSYFSSKQDYAGYIPYSKGGGVLTGLVRSVMGSPSLSGCGTSPSITGNNQAGQVTLGTGTPTGCTITFSTSNPFSVAPVCVVTWQANIASMQYMISQTAIVLTQTATDSNKVNYICWGMQ